MLFLVNLFVPNAFLEMKCDLAQETGHQGLVTKSAPRVGLTPTLCPHVPQEAETPAIQWHILSLALGFESELTPFCL